MQLKFIDKHLMIVIKLLLKSTLKTLLKLKQSAETVNKQLKT